MPCRSSQTFACSGDKIDRTLLLRDEMARFRRYTHVSLLVPEHQTYNVAIPHRQGWLATGRHGRLTMLGMHETRLRFCHETRILLPLNPPPWSDPRAERRNVPRPYPAFSVPRRGLLVACYLRKSVTNSTATKRSLTRLVAHQPCTPVNANTLFDAHLYCHPYGAFGISVLKVHMPPRFV
jgi:hypothetical protein